MTHTANTLALSDDWDLTLDESGNLVTHKGLEAILQNVSNECRLFFMDAYFRFDDGVRWASDLLAKPLQEAVLRDRLSSAALRVPGVLAVDRVEIHEIDKDERILHGKIFIRTEVGDGVSSF